VLSVTVQIFSEVEHYFNISRVVNGADTESNLDTLTSVLQKEQTFHTNAVQKYCGMSAVSQNRLIRSDVCETINSDAAMEYVMPCNVTNGSTAANGFLCGSVPTVIL
jgi:hypothetical protein